MAATAAPIVRTPLTDLPYAGREEKEHEALLFCNGIMTELPAAQKNARTISETFHGRKVYVFHNPTTLTGFVQPDIEEIERQIASEDSMVFTLKDYIGPEQMNRVVLFVHSHGAVLAKYVLQILEEPYREKISVYAFGGATVIPNALAGKVHNYVFDQDLIADTGNIYSETHLVLSKHKEVARMMREEEGHTQEGAINQLAYRALHMRLWDDFTPEGRSQFQQIFVRKDLDALVQHPEFNAVKEEYSSCLRDYTVTILEGTPFEHPEYEELRRHANFPEFLSNLPDNLSSMFGNACKGLSALGSHALQHHYFSEYKGVLPGIAQAEDPQDDTD